MKICFKRICAAVLAVVLTMSFCTVLGSANNLEICALNNGEIGLLKKLGIVTGDTLDFSAEIKRGELAYTITKFCNITPEENAEPYVKFYDLTTDHRYFPHINECIKRGIFSGDGTGYFRPEDTATFKEACKVFSVALGYKIVGYLGSYVDTARVSGITDGVSPQEKLTLATMAEMAYNALNTGMFEAKSYGAEMEFVVNENYTAIEHYHNLKRGKGVLDGIYGTTLAMPSDAVPENEIQIAGKRYTYENGSKLFGRNVVFFTDVQDKSRAPQIQYIYADEDKNTEITVKADNMIGKFGNIVKYYSGNNERKFSFSDIGDVIINGVAYPEYVDADFLPDCGELTFVDNNNDHVFDVAIIDDVEFLIVGAIDSENEIIYDKNDPNNVLGSKTNDNIDLKLKRGDTEAHMSLISVGSPVSVRKSRNTSGILKIDVRIPDSTVSGLVGSIYEDCITIDGEKNYLAKNAIYDEAVSIGDVVDLCVFDGLVGVVIHKKDGYMYGYLVGAEKDDEAFASSLSVRLVNTNMKAVTYECVKSLRIDETVQRNADTVLGLLSSSALLTYQQYSTSPYTQPIRYKLTKDGKVSHIDTAAHNTATEKEDALQLDKSAATHRYYASSHSFYNNGDESLEYAMSSATTAWIVPRKYRDDEEWYSSGFSNNGNYTIEAFNVDEFTCAPKLVVAYSSNGESLSVSGGAPPYIITDVETVMTDEGDLTKKITVVGASSTPLERLLNKRVPDMDLNVGDVIRFNGGSKGDIVVLERVAMAGQIPATRLQNYGTITGFAFQAPIRYAYGTVVANKDGLMVHTTSITDDDGGGVENYANRNAYRIKNTIPVWVYDDTRTPTVSAGLWSDIIPYETNKTEPTRAFIYTASGALQFIYISK